MKKKTTKVAYRERRRSACWWSVGKATAWRDCDVDAVSSWCWRVLWKCDQQSRTDTAIQRHHIMHADCGIPCPLISANLKHFDDRAFAAAGPGLRNSLTPQLRDADLPYSRFRRSLKIFLFGEWVHSAVRTILTVPSYLLTFSFSRLLKTYYFQSVYPAT